VGGIAVHVGARVMALAGSGQLMVSDTVRQVLLGSRYAFKDHGRHSLKGVPGEWQLFVFD
jgi:class 3 adenylate cyclase